KKGVEENLERRWWLSWAPSPLSGCSSVTPKDLRLGHKGYVFIQRENRSRAACVTKAFEISAGGARCIHVQQKFCSMLKHVRLAMGRLHDDGLEGCRILSVREKQGPVVEANGFAGYNQSDVFRMQDCGASTVPQAPVRFVAKPTIG